MLTLPTNEEDIFIPWQITKIMISRDECTSDWFHNPTGVSGISLESSMIKEGLLEFRNGNIFTGEVTHGLLHGKGKLTFKTGVVYEGNFNMNRIEGEGVITWPNGAKFTGNFVRGKRHGFGEYYNPHRDVTYKGEFQNGLRHGKGELFLKDGSVYKGEFVKGKKHGFGTVEYPSGNKYEGEWKENKKNGTGTMHWYDYKERYHGEWKDDLPNGIGTLIFLEEKAKNRVLRNRYSGCFKNGNRHGLGIFYYADGSIYEGQWKSGKKDGYGVFIDDKGKADYGYYEKDRVVRDILVSNTLLETLINVDNKRKDTYLEYSRDSNMVNSPIRTNQNQENRIRSTNPRIMGTLAIREAENQRNRNRSDIVNQNTNIQQEDNGLESNSNENSRIVRHSTETHQDEIMEYFSEKTDPVLRMSPEEINAFREINLYFDLVKINDFITDEGRRRIQIKLCETLLRHHSDIKKWYKAYVEKNEKEYEEGFFMNFKSFTILLKDARLLNGRLNIANLGRLLTGYGERDFELYFNETEVTNKIELMSRYDFNKPKQDSQATFSIEPYDIDLSKDKEKPHETVANDKRTGVLSDDKESTILGKIRKKGGPIGFEKKIEQILIDQYKVKNNRLEKCVDQDKVILQRIFVNALVRAVHLKTGSINKLPEKVHKIFTERINPIVMGKIKPKVIVGEDNSILRRSQKVLKKYEKELKELYDIACGLKTKFNKNKFLDLKSFLDLMSETKQMKYGSGHEKKLMWMILERVQDPEESIFRLVMKIEKRAGKSHPTINTKIRDLILMKLQAEMTLDEFKEIFINSINSRHSTFVPKLQNFLKAYLPRFKKGCQNLKKRQIPKPRFFPITQKDKEVRNIEKIREKRLEALRVKKARQTRKRNEKEERGLMKQEDYDVTNILAGLVEAMDSEEAEEEESEVYLDDESFFEVIEDQKESVELEKSYISGKTGKTGKTRKQNTARSYRTRRTERSARSRNENVNNSQAIGRTNTRVINNSQVLGRSGSRLNNSRAYDRTNTRNTRANNRTSNSQVTRADTIRSRR